MLRNTHKRDACSGTKQCGGKLLPHSDLRRGVFVVWVDNIRMDLQEVGCGYMDWIELAQDRDRWRMLVSAVMNLRVP